MEGKSGIPHVEDISYEYFFDNFLKLNTPCIIKKVADKWQSSKLWILRNKPCFDYLSDKYGNSEVTIHNCCEKYFNSQKTSHMSCKDFINYWKSYIENGYPKEMPIYYLKDWHMKNIFKDDPFYTTPIYFSCDWLNEYLTSCDMDDYRFVYMGPKGSWTPFHRDVFSSYSWSANICGTKRWILFPPGEEEKLLDELGNIPYDIKNIPNNTKYFEIVQLAGEAIFVPSGWYHQVFNLEDTISINHNWLNGCNIKLMWHAMENELSSIIKEISDCKDMENFSEQCQLILKSTFGMNFEELFKFLNFIALKRVTELQQERSKQSSSSKFIIFDLESIKGVLQLFIAHTEIKTPYFQTLKTCALETITKIAHAIELKEADCY